MHATRHAAATSLFDLTKEQRTNIKAIHGEQESAMAEFVQDVVSMVTMGAFLASMAFLIGAF
jgi:Spy/CpxP family protein refolding chaperone